MKKYRIENRTSGIILGVFEATSAEAALDAMAREAGYASYAEVQEVAEGDLTVTLVEEG